MIKLITESVRKEEGLTFNDVEYDEFFIDEYGFLCQKVNGSCAITIADSTGILYANFDDAVRPRMGVKEIIKVSKIEFGGLTSENKVVE